MKKIKEIARLRLECNLSMGPVARAIITTEIPDYSIINYRLI